MLVACTRWTHAADLGGGIIEAHVANFDELVNEHDEMLVHFYAPWSKRCDIIRPHLEELARSDAWGERVVHAKSDISDQRGYLSLIHI